MTSEEIIAAADDALLQGVGQPLTDIQTLILKACLQGKKYSEISAYETQHIKNEASKLWRLLAQATGEPKVSKANFRSVLNRYCQKQRSLQSKSFRHDWGNAPDLPIFCGRDQELSTLKTWIQQDRCRVVAILGMAGVGKTQLSVKLGKGGIGKTDLSLKLAQSIEEEFDYIIWRKLLNAPPITEILADCIQILSNQNDADLPETIDEQIKILLGYLQAHRCLIILDNVETILQGRHRVGEYLEGYEQYGQLFDHIGKSAHQSCLLLTSRETPKALEQLEGNARPVRFYHLGGLNAEDGKQIFQSIGEFVGEDEAWRRLIDLYNGNPLALELAAHHIRDVFGGNISHFQKVGKPIFSELNELLDWHYERLSEQEREVLFWLAINREPVSLAEIANDLVTHKSRHALQETLKILQKQLPLERSEDKQRFTIQPVLIEYMTARLIQQCCDELSSGNPNLFNRHALLKAQAPDFVKQSQIRKDSEGSRVV